MKLLSQLKAVKGHGQVMPTRLFNKVIFNEENDLEVHIDCPNKLKKKPNVFRFLPVTTNNSINAVQINSNNAPEQSTNDPVHVAAEQSTN